MEKRDYELFTLPNGIRIVHKRVAHTKVVHCGFVLDIGSRDENELNQGIAHFWEHMAFKGTKRRRAFHILNKLDAVGGELNAYTTKEKITFYASVLDDFFEKAFDLLTDITFNSVFPQRQIERERQVILEEMAMYKDSPEDAIQDEFDNIVFANHPLGMNILGNNETITTFNKANFDNFITENIDTERIVFSCVGNISMKRVVKLAEKFLGDFEKKSSQRRRITFSTYIPETKKLTRNVTQSLCAMGKPGYAFADKNRIPFFMLVNTLGGPAMNSRLNLALREKHGFVYSIDANYSAYSDTGLFSIYFGTEPRQLMKSITLVKKELRRLREVPLGTRQLHVAKEQLMGQMAMSEENNANLMLMMGKSLINSNKIESIEEVFGQIKKITSGQLQDMANEMFDDNMLSYLTFLPN